MQQPPFHNPNLDPLPDTNDIEAEFQGRPAHLHEDDEAFQLSARSRSRLESDKRWMRNFIIGLLAAGLAMGGLLAVGLAWGMNQMNMVDPPANNSSESAE